jgi:D-alanyl-D-alanine endopeptidase (penicillin-binding protein 7)
MIRRATLPKVLLLLAFFVFFSAGTIHFVESPDRPNLFAAVEKNYQLDFDDAASKGLRLNLKSALVCNYDNGEVIFARNPDLVRPIASITKLVTVMVVIDQGVDLDSTAVITKEDAYRSSRSRLRVGYELTLHDLLYAALMNSDNRAARALARATAGTIEDFARLMNAKARKLGLKQTKFTEPTGLDQQNVSTAHEVARIMHYAHDYDLIAKITSAKSRMIKVQNRNKRLQMANTNLMIHSKYKVLSGKTGYIRAADYCLTTLVKSPQGERMTVVVLGVPGDRLRFREARKLADYAAKRI